MTNLGQSKIKLAKMDLSINKIVKNLVTNDVFLATSLKRGYINLSAVARDLRPRIEAWIGDTVNEDAIVSALKRNRDVSRKFDSTVMEALSQTSIHMITGITKVVIHSGNTITLRESMGRDSNEPIYITTGSEFTTIIAEDRRMDDFENLLRKGVISRKSGLALLVLKCPVSIMDAPGFLMSIYSKLAFSGINIEETTNSYTDSLIIVSEQESGEAYGSILELIDFAKGNIVK